MIRLVGQTECIGILVMKDSATIDYWASEQIKNHRTISLQHIKNILAFRPIIKLTLRPPENLQDIVIILYLEYFKDNQKVWQLQEERLLEEVFYYLPQSLLNLAPYHQDQAIVGNWEIKLSIIAMRKHRYTSIPREKRDENCIIIGFSPVCHFKWQVTSE